MTGLVPSNGSMGGTTSSTESIVCPTKTTCPISMPCRGRPIPDLLTGPIPWPRRLVKGLLRITLGPWQRTRRCGVKVEFPKIKVFSQPLDPGDKLPSCPGGPDELATIVLGDG